MSGEGLSLVYQNLIATNGFNRCKALGQTGGFNSSFVFGKPGEKDPEGAKEIVSTWKFHMPSREVSSRRDFRSANKRCVKRGLSTSKDFRADLKSEVLITQHKEGTNSSLLILPDEDFAYGNPNKPPTPLNDLLANVYGNQSAVIMQEVYKNRLAEVDSYKVKKKTSYLPKLTRATALVHEVAVKKLQDKESIPSEKLFKLKKFDNIKPKIDTTNRGYRTLRSIGRDINIRSASHDVANTSKIC